MACSIPLRSHAQDITLGVIASVTRLGATYGAGIVQGAEMAVRDINSAGGVAGRRIKLIVADDASDPARSAIAMRRLVSANVDLVVGGFGSPQVLANLEIAEQSGTPYIVVAATNPEITSPSNKWTVRVIQTDSVMAEQLARFAAGELGLKRIAVINDSNAYGVGNRDVFVAALEELGAAVVAVESYQTADTDFESQLRRIRDGAPEAIAIFGTVPAAPAVMNQARALGIQARFLGTGGLANDSVISLAPASSQGTILTSHFDEEADPAAKAWSARYRREFAGRGHPPHPVLAAWEYRAIRDIAFPCLKAVGTDRIRLRDCIARWKGWTFGIDGEIHFDESGQLVQPPIMVEIRGGAFVRIKGRP
jgi:branched-chain amino acid transport system substrate-binding protein